MSRNSFSRKSLFLGLIILVITGFSAISQVSNPAMGTSPWKFANPSPIGFTWTDMSFIDDNTGLAVGVNGGIARTTDGGRNWVGLPFKYVTNSNTVALGNFADVHFVTTTMAYAVGSGGLMVKSVDGGMNWSQITTPLTALGRNINGLHFLNKDTGYIGGAALTSSNTTNINDAPKVYFTRNGGSTWDSLASPFRPQQNAVTLSGFNTGEIHRIHFVNDSVGYVSGSCGSAVANFSAILWKIEKNVVKDYSIHRTKFGITATTGSYTPATQTFKGLLGINDSLVLISSLNNNVTIRVRTGKNDSTANAAPLIYGAYERGVYEIMIWLNSTATPFPANLVNIVAGQGYQIKKGPGNKIFLTQGPNILTSTDNGTNWSFTKPHPTTVNYGHWQFSAMDVTANGKIVIGSFNGLTYDSLPGSPSWQTVYKNARPLFYSFSDMDWADYCNGLVVGSNGTIIKTTDGGKSWANISNPILEAAQVGLTNVQYQAVNNMFFSTGTSVFQSPDQGSTLNALFTEPNVNGFLNGFTMQGQRAWTIGYRFSPVVERTVIFRTLNAYAASPVWDTVKTFPTGTLAPQLRNIKFANQDTGYTSGNRGKVYRTTNGGTTWTDVSPDTLVNSNGTANYTALSVVNGKTLYVGGTSRRIFRSTDAGATWTDLTLPVPTTPSPITSFSSIGLIIMNDANNGYATAGAAVLRTSNGWSTYSYDLSPGGYNAMALYPKIPGPIEGKKLYGMPLTAGSPVNSTNTAFLIEYGNSSLTTMASTEAAAGATCTNLNGGSITVTTTGGVAPYSYSINGGPFQSSNVFTGLTQGPKTVTIKDAGCQSFTKTVTVGFTDNLTLTTSNDTLVCAGAPVQLIANSNAGSFSWTPAAGLNNANISNPVATVSNYTQFTVTASLNGCVKTRTINVRIKSNPTVDAGPDRTIVLGDQVTLQGTGSGGGTITWTPAAGLSNANLPDPIAKPQTTTNYLLTVKNSEGCTSTDNVVITVIPYCVNIMNAFTPNGDGTNDRWMVTNGAACTSNIVVTVFNRYGNIVYQDKNYQNNWNGTYNGKPVPEGTYYYTASFTTITGTPILLKGDVTILR